jgi:succinate dehydrogenase/fumarate reductase flavoprotein subunit
MTTVVPHQRWDEDVDVPVAGSGLGTAVISASHGARVAVVEKAACIGGTTTGSAGYMWIPNTSTCASPVGTTRVQMPCA